MQSYFETFVDSFRAKRQTFLSMLKNKDDFYKIGFCSSVLSFPVLQDDIEFVLAVIKKNAPTQHCYESKRWMAEFVNQYAPNCPEFHTIEMFSHLMSCYSVSNADDVCPMFPWQAWIDRVQDLVKHFKHVYDAPDLLFWNQYTFIVRHAPEIVWKAPRNKWLQGVIMTYSMGESIVSLTLEEWVQKKTHESMPLCFDLDRSRLQTLNIGQKNPCWCYVLKHLRCSIRVPFIRSALQEIILTGVNNFGKGMEVGNVCSAVVQHHLEIHESDPTFFSKQIVMQICRCLFTQLWMENDHFIQFVHFVLLQLNIFQPRCHASLETIPCEMVYLFLPFILPYFNRIDAFKVRMFHCTAL